MCIRDRGKGAHDKIINAFKNKGADILVGTQMIAKGLDFPNVTLVGVIIADTSLNLPDFRAAERTFQLITQVAGRAGRGCIRGTVLVQTYEPSHYSLLYASKHDFKGFYQEEITPVSYTHLDVYKRQTLLSSKKSTGPHSALNEDGTYARYAEGDEDYEIFLRFVEYHDTDGYYFLQFFQDCSGSHQFRWTYYPPKMFKILLYFPELDHFIVSHEVYERYAFDSYFTAHVSDTVSYTHLSIETTLYQQAARQ